MHIACDCCEGTGEIHDFSCLTNKTFEEDDCSCNPTKCRECKGKGYQELKKIKQKKSEEY